MVAYYIERIKEGKKALDQVPRMWRSDVEWEMNHEKKGNLSK